MPKNITFDAHETQRLMELEGKPLAPFFRRAVAFAIDLLMAVIISMILFVGYNMLNGEFFRGKDLKVDFNFENWYSISASLLYFGIATYVSNGQPIGKKLMRIRVVSLTQPRVTLWQSFERSLGYGASILEGGFGFFQYFINPNRRTVHDRIAETIVADEKPSRDMDNIRSNRIE
jgi:uncharacterized RDD family membrane protein YckC